MFCCFGFSLLHIIPVFTTDGSPSALKVQGPILKKWTGPHESLDWKPIDF